MSVRQSLLALLAERPSHGYGLKSGFEDRTAGAWSLNVGQVYTTLARLRRDGLVESEAAEGEGGRTWRITDRGRVALADWYGAPVLEDPPPRDELAIKVLLAVAAADVDVAGIVQRQREATMERLQRLTRQKARADAELAWLLLLDRLVLEARAELDWLDLCEQRLAAARGGEAGR